MIRVLTYTFGSGTEAGAIEIRPPSNTDDATNAAKRGPLNEVSVSIRQIAAAA